VKRRAGARFLDVLIEFIDSTEPAARERTV
jgi:hypothetical protein